MYGRVMLHRHALFRCPAVAARVRLAKDMASAIPAISRCVGRRTRSARQRARLPAKRPRNPRAPLPSLAWRTRAPRPRSLAPHKLEPPRRHAVRPDLRLRWQMGVELCCNR